jgi:hypothetical protein
MDDPRQVKANFQSSQVVERCKDDGGWNSVEIRYELQTGRHGG